MRLALLAIGRLKRGPEQELVLRYKSRIDALARANGVTPIELIEVPESRARSAPERQAEEAAALRPRSGDAKLLAWDERGTSLSSSDLACRVGAWRDAGHDLASAIGGPDGLHSDLRASADLVLSFGRLTLPHQLVRVLVLEQLYRCLTILSGHPYHRGEGA